MANRIYERVIISATPSNDNGVDMIQVKGSALVQDKLKINSEINVSTLHINGNSDSNKSIIFSRNDVPRWEIKSSGAESTGYIGSNLEFVKYDNTGTVYSVPFIIKRDTSNLLLGGNIADNLVDKIQVNGSGYFNGQIYSKYEQYGRIDRSIGNVFSKRLGTIEDFESHVVLLHPVYTGVIITHNECNGNLTARRGGTMTYLVNDIYKISTSSAYNEKRFSLQSKNAEYGKYVTCSYNGVTYVAIKFDGSGSVEYSFDGYIVGDDNSLKVIPYYNTSTSTVINSEINSSLSDIPKNAYYPSFFKGSLSIDYDLNVYHRTLLKSGNLGNNVDLPSSIFRIQGNDQGLFFGTYNGTPDYGPWIQSTREAFDIYFNMYLQPLGGRILIGSTADDLFNRLQVVGGIKNKMTSSTNYSYIGNSELVIGARGGGYVPMLASKFNDSYSTSLYILSAQDTDNIRYSEDDMMFRTAVTLPTDVVSEYTTPGSAFGFYNGGRSLVKISRSGNVGINCLNAVKILEVNTSHSINIDDEIRIGSYYSGFFGLGLNYRIDGVGAPSMHIVSYDSGNKSTNITLSPNGNVGIGVLNPECRLEVKSEIRLRSNIDDARRLNFVWWSDGSGAIIDTYNFSNNTDRYPIYLQPHGSRIIIGGTTDNLLDTLQVTGNVNINEGLLNVYNNGAAMIMITSPSSNAKDIYFNSGEFPRWTIRTNNTPETGSNSGSDFEIISRDDLGSPTNSPLFITRSTQNVIICSRYDNLVDKFQVNGSVWASGNITTQSNMYAIGYYTTSDIRLKNIIDYDIENIGDLKTISYRWKDTTKKQNKNIGYSAQDVENIMPDAVSEDNFGNKTIDYIQVLVAKVSELEEKIKVLQNGVQ